MLLTNFLVGAEEFGGAVTDEIFVLWGNSFVNLGTLPRWVSDEISYFRKNFSGLHAKFCFTATSLINSRILLLKIFFV